MFFFLREKRNVKSCIGRTVYTRASECIRTTVQAPERTPGNPNYLEDGDRRSTRSFVTYVGFLPTKTCKPCLHFDVLDRDHL